MEGNGPLKYCDVSASLLNLKFSDIFLFVLLHDRQKLSDVAREMKISVPTAERRLNLLREAFDDRLFTRGGANGAFMIPTARAEAIYASAAQMLEGYVRSHRTPTFDPSEVSTCFRFALNSHGIFFLGTNFFQKLSEKCPKATAMIVKPADDIIDMLRSGEADFAIYHRCPKENETGIHTMPIHRCEMSILVRKGHPLEKKAETVRLTPEDLRPYPAVRLYSKPRKYRIERYIDTLLAPEVEQTTQVALPFFAVAPYLLQMNDRTCICPTVIGRYWAQTGLVTCLSADFVRATDLHLIWHDRTHTLPEFQYVRSLLADSRRTA